MKQISLFSKIVALFLLVGFFSSCDPTEDTDPPIVRFQAEGDALTGDTMLSSGETFTVVVNAIQGTNLMRDLEILANGTSLATERFTVDSEVSNNPRLLFDDEKEEFTYTIEIEAQIAGDVQYEFVVSDEGGVTMGSADLTITTTSGPAVSVDGSTNIELDAPAQNLVLTLMATPANANLSTLSVYEDGELVETSRLDYGDISVPFSTNPLDLPTEDIEGFTTDIYLSTHTTIESKVYEFIVTDVDGNEGSVTVTITLTGTPLNVFYSGVTMYNDAGQMNGAIDLETGEDVSSLTAEGDIRDSGLDINSDWAMTMEPHNGASLRAIENGATYESVETLEDLLDAYNTGTALTQTGTLVVGSTYVASVGLNYYILTVTDVVETNNDNNDYYTFDIKGTNL